MPTITRPCEHCGTPFEAKRSTAKFCTPAHGVAHRRQSSAATSPAAEPTPGPQSGVASRVIRDLEKAGVLDTFDGQCAVSLALAIDKGEESASVRASGIKALREAMQLALAGSQPAPTPAAAPATPQDEVGARRDARRASV